MVNVLIVGLIVHYSKHWANFEYLSTSNRVKYDLYRPGSILNVFTMIIDLAEN